MTEIIIAIIGLVAGGGITSGIVALRKDQRESRMDDLSFAEQIRRVARQEVKETRDDMVSLKGKVDELSTKVQELEKQLQDKDDIISSLIGYIRELRNILTNDKRPLPQVPEAIRHYIE